MDFGGAVLVLVRRWYVTVPAFLVAVILAITVYTSAPQQFVSGSVLVLTAPPTGASTRSDPAAPNWLVNPMLNFDQGLSNAALIVIQALGTPEVAVELGAGPGSDTEFKVSNGSTNPELLTSGPFVYIQGISTSAGGAKAIVERVGERARAELAARQRALNAPQATFITVSDVVPATTSEPMGASRKRAAGAVGALGVFAALAAAFATDSLVRARRRRLAGQSQ